MIPPLDPGQKFLAIAAAAPVLFFLFLLVGRLLRRRAGVQLGVLYQLLAIVLAFFIPLTVLKVNIAGNGFDLHRELGVGAFLLGISFFLALLRRYVWELYFEQARRITIPKFLSQLVGLVLITIAVLLVTKVAYGKDVSVLLAGSTIVAAIIGFAMQDLLGNIISGVALQVSKPYREGDWLFIDGQYAEVMEINWRSTRFRNNDNIYLDIPNSTIVKNTIVNVNYHTRHYSLRIRVGIDYSVPPNRVKAALLRAVSTAKGVLRTPQPKVFLVDFGDSAITYEVKYFINDHRNYNDVADAVRTGIWYELHRQEINIPFPIRTVKIERSKGMAGAPSLLDRVKGLVHGKAFFECLGEAQLEQLISNSQLLSFGRDEFIIEKGADGNSMFILVSGAAGVHLSADGSGEPVAVLKPGDCFGEMSLLTGEPRSATIVAKSDCEVVEIAKRNFAGILLENSELFQQLSELLARRRLENEGALSRTGTETSNVAEKQREYTAGFLQRITHFFQL